MKKSPLNSAEIAKEPKSFATPKLKKKVSIREQVNVSVDRRGSLKRDKEVPDIEQTLERQAESNTQNISTLNTEN